MHVLRVGPVAAPEDADAARCFDAAFGLDTLRAVHGPSVQVTPWDAAGRRTVRFDVAVDAIPPEIRRFFCGDTLRVTARQTLQRRADAWAVRNDLRMAFVGAELFRIAPRFELRLPDARAGRPAVELRGEVRHRALLPPPLKGLAEALMARHSARELARFEAAARAALAR